jgi:hypothetical protein
MASCIGLPRLGPGFVGLVQPKMRNNNKLVGIPSNDEAHGFVSPAFAWPAHAKDHGL